MEFAEFLKRRIKYQGLAEKRDAERMSLGSGMDDTPYYLKVIEEMLIEFTERLESIEEVLSPKQEVNAEKTEPGEVLTRKPKLY